MATGTHKSTTTNPIMLRFRPILPKPAAEGFVSASGNQNAVFSKRRFKRKYVRARRTYGRKNGKFGKLEAPRSPELGTAAAVTLPLLPEKAQLNEVITGKNFNITEKLQILHDSGPTRVSAEAGGEVSDKDAAAAKSTVVVESWVTVESVTETCMGEGEVGGLLGCTDVERVKVLETDTCPGFVSDGYCRVPWVNNAFKRMVVSDDEEMGKPLPEVVVWLKVKDNAVRRCYSYLAFTCGVRLQYTWRNDKCKKMVPCDVWRLDCGGFAWRLDVKAALSLGI